MMERLTRGKRRDEILHPDASEEPSVVKKWCRRHDNGCVGVVAAWSDGGYTGGYSEDFRATAASRSDPGIPTIR